MDDSQTRLGRQTEVSTFVAVPALAAGDILQVLDWYLRTAPEQASRFAAELAKMIDLIGRNPLLFPPMYGDIRRVPFRVFPRLMWFV